MLRLHCVTCANCMHHDEGRNADNRCFQISRDREESVCLSVCPSEITINIVYKNVQIKILKSQKVE